MEVTTIGSIFFRKRKMNRDLAMENKKNGNISAASELFRVSRVIVCSYYFVYRQLYEFEFFYFFFENSSLNLGIMLLSTCKIIVEIGIPEFSDKRSNVIGGRLIVKVTD